MSNYAREFQDDDELMGDDSYEDARAAAGTPFAARVADWPVSASSTGPSARLRSI